MANLPQVVNPNLHEDFLNLLQELQLSSLWAQKSTLSRIAARDICEAESKKNIWNLSENTTYVTTQYYPVILFLL